MHQEPKIVIVTEKGVILKFPAKHARTANRGGKGTRAINLQKGDKVVSSSVVYEQE